MQNGGLAVPSILKYYKAAQLVALGPWWTKVKSKSESWRLEQVAIDIPLYERIILNKLDRLKLQKRENTVRNALAKIWDEVKVTVAPGVSPIASYFYHPLFASNRWVANSEHWKRAAYWRLCDCVRGQQIKSLHEIRERIESMPLIQFQYIQIYNTLKLCL